MSDKLRVIDAEPVGPSVQERLSEVQQAVDEGRVSSVAVCLVYRDGTTSWCWSDAPSMSLLIGASTRMQHAMLRETDG